MVMFSAEQRREKSLGQGVFLSRVHGAKGLEFEHMIIDAGLFYHWPGIKCAKWSEP